MSLEFIPSASAMYNGIFGNIHGVDEGVTVLGIYGSGERINGWGNTLICGTDIRIVGAFIYSRAVNFNISFSSLLSIIDGLFCVVQKEAASVEISGNTDIPQVIVISQTVLAGVASVMASTIRLQQLQASSISVPAFKIRNSSAPKRKPMSFDEIS